jgi:hypothetical protein
LVLGYLFGIVLNGRRTFGNLRGDIIRTRKPGFEEADALGTGFGGNFSN